MIDRTFAAPSTTFRNVWIFAGALLAASGILGVVHSPLLAGPLGLAEGGLTPLVILLLGAGGMLFALGFRGVGSVTARRPLGTTAIILLVAILPFARLFVWDAVPPSVYASGWLFFYTGIDLLVEFALALVAAIAIARAGVVPPPWCRAPLWAVGVSAAAEAVRVVVGILGDGAFVDVVVGIAHILPALATASLGVIAILLVTRGRVAR